MWRTDTEFISSNKELKSVYQFRSYDDTNTQIFTKTYIFVLGLKEKCMRCFVQILVQRIPEWCVVFSSSPLITQTQLEFLFRPRAGAIIVQTCGYIMNLLPRVKPSLRLTFIYFNILYARRNKICECNISYWLIKFG